MELDTRPYIRNPLIVHAVQVTEANFAEVAKWCDGTISNIDGTPINWAELRDGNYVTVYDASKQYISVKVLNPKTIKQSQAFLGDWVMIGPSASWKVYTDRAFRANFQETTLNAETASAKNEG